MIEKFEPALWEQLYRFAENTEYFFELGEYLKSIGDPRGPDVYEVGILDYPADIADDERVAFRLGRGQWWELYRLTSDVMCRIRPRTAQRQRAEKYGRTHYAAPFMTKAADRARLEEKFSDPADIAAWLDMLEPSRRKKGGPFAESIGEDEARDLIGEEKFEASDGKAAFDKCRASLVLMQFGATPSEVSGRHVLHGEGCRHRYETLAEYHTVFVPGTLMYREEKFDNECALKETAGSCHFPAWMAELRQANPGRFEWVMGLLEEHEDEYPGVVARVQEVVPYTPRGKKTPKRPRRKK